MRGDDEGVALQGGFRVFGCLGVLGLGCLRFRV